MKREALITKIVAWLLCAMMVIGYLPAAAIATSADWVADEWETPIDPPDETEPEPGSAEAPIALTALENTVTVPAGSTVYYSSRHNGMIMTVTGTTGYEILVGEEATADTEGTVTMNVVCDTFNPLVFAVVNNTEADVEYTINFTYPEGSMENPYEASLYENAVSVKANDADGYYLTYVADYTGTLQITITSESGWAYCVNNLTAYAYGENQFSDSDPVVNPAIVSVTAGDEIQIMVNTYNPEDQWNTPAGDITVDIQYVAGSCPEYPIFLGNTENAVTNAGTVYYNGYFSGTTMTVAGEGDFTVTYNGEAIAAVDGVVSIPVSTSNPRMPVEFSVTGDGDYTISFVYPVGSANNPLIAVLGDNVANVEANNNQGFLMTYTAEYTGKLMVTLSTDDGNWQYTVNNMTSYVYGDAQWSDSDPVVNPAVVDVTAGDEIQIVVNTYNPDDTWSTPAGKVNVNLAYQPGSCPEFSIFLGNMENSVTNAGTVYYQGYFSGTVMTVTGEGDFSVVYNGETIAAVDGVVSIPVSTSNPRMPVEFSVIGDGDYTISFAYPVGSSNNPAVAVLGDNLATIEAASQGYYWTYTAEQAGDLVFTFTSSDGNWIYTINNMTSGSYGDMQWSDSDPVVNPATITVAAGDELQIIVNTYDPSAWEGPAGTVTFNMVYDVPETPSVNLRFAGASLVLKSDLTMNFKVREAVQRQYENIWVEFEMNGVKTVVKESTMAGTEMNFAFQGIAPRMIKDNIAATIHGTFDGVEYTYTLNYSAYKNIQSLIGTTDTTLQTLLVDLMNYGTAHQIYMAYNTNDLINAGLTEEQKAWGTSGDPVLENITSGKYVAHEAPTASFKAPALKLSNAVEVVFNLNCANLTDMNGVALKIEIDDGENGIITFMVDAANFEYDEASSTYKVYFTNLLARQLRCPIYATIMQNGEAISHTMRYSVESYAYSMQSNTSVLGLADLVKAMIRYGDATYAYVNS